MKKKNVLVKIDSNWADEFDVSGWKLFSKEEWEKSLLDAKAFFEKNRGRRNELELSFGTNEALTFDSFEEYTAAYTAEELTPKELSVLLKYWPGEECGTFVYFDGFDLEEDEEDDEEDDEEETEEEAALDKANVLEIVVNTLNRELEKADISADTKIADIRPDDPVALLEVIAVIEWEFGVEIPDEEIETLQTVQDLADWIFQNEQK